MRQKCKMISIQLQLQIINRRNNRASCSWSTLFVCVLLVIIIVLQNIAQLTTAQNDRLNLDEPEAEASEQLEKEFQITPGAYYVNPIPWRPPIDHRRAPQISNRNSTHNNDNKKKNNRLLYNHQHDKQQELTTNYQLIQDQDQSSSDLASSAAPQNPSPTSGQPQEWPFVKSFQQSQQQRAANGRPGWIRNLQQHHQENRANRLIGNQQQQDQIVAFVPLVGGTNETSSKKYGPQTAMIQLRASQPPSQQNLQTTSGDTAPSPMTASDIPRTIQNSVSNNGQEFQANLTEPNTTTSTTTPAPSLIDRQTSAAQSNAIEPLFDAKFHSTIQAALEGILKESNSMKSVTTGQSDQPSDASRVRSAKLMYAAPEMSSIATNDSMNGIYSTPSPADQSQTMATTTPRPSSSGRGVLSLNVLLKNFGTQSLSNLDQIMLSSRMNSNNLNKETKQDEQRIQISGFRQQPHNDQISPSTTPHEHPKLINEPNQADLRTAECKIEYAKKHVNISLQEESSSQLGDYTCDYMIDRKPLLMHDKEAAQANQGSNDMTMSDIMDKVCRLELKSSYFSNESLTESDRSSSNDNCTGSYLIIGHLKFCSLFNAIGDIHRKVDRVSLRRVFDFPLDREAFDLKIVHHQHHQNPENYQMEAKNKLPTSNDIHLIIKPISDGHCIGQQSRQLEQHHGLSSSTTRPLPVSSYETVTSSSIREQTSGSQDKPANTLMREREEQNLMKSMRSDRLEMSNDNRDQHLRGTTDPMSTPTATHGGRMPADGNSRQQQSATVTRSVPNTSANVGLSSLSPDTTLGAGGGGTNGGETFYNYQDDSEDSPHCPVEELEFRSSSGQLASPQYPADPTYANNLNCSYTIKPASQSYCQILILFRDFSLRRNLRIEEGESSHTTASADVESQNNCEQAEDEYLTIYSGFAKPLKLCNHLSMTGHKMKLYFGPEREIQFHFRTSPARRANQRYRASGRGFLIKYHQLVCDSSAASQDLRAISTRQAVMSPQRSNGSGASGSPRPGRIRFEQPAKPEVARSTSTATTLPMEIIDDYVTNKKLPPMKEPDFGKLLNNNNRARLIDNQHDQGASLGSSISSSSSTTTTRRPQTTIASHPTTISNSNSMLPMASTLSTQSSTFSTGNHLASSSNNNNNDCNQVHSEMNFLVSSPNYPGFYPTNIDCNYYIRRNNSRVCYLEFSLLKFDLEPDADCRFDYVEVNKIRLCGSLASDELGGKTTRIYQFNEPIKLVRFRSDDRETRSGFLTRIEQLECGPTGTIIRRLSSPSPLLMSNEQKLSSSQNNENNNQVTISLQHNNSSKYIIYDDLPAPPPSGNALRPLQNSPSKLLLHGKHSDVVLKPLTERRLGSSDNNNNQSQSPKPLPAAAATSRTNQTNQDLSGRGILLSSPVGGGHDISSSSYNDDRSGTLNCDQVIVGLKETTIRSPGWPESYLNEESLNTCKYTIHQVGAGGGHSFGRKVCQLELRFVHLRLGPTDCLDLDGQEIICGFDKRNLVKFYSFDRRPYFTINFITGTGLNAKRARSDLRATVVADISLALKPRRFMIVVKQHDCIDGFLSPTNPIGVEQDPFNKQLLYSPATGSQSSSLTSNLNDGHKNSTATTSTSRGYISTTFAHEQNGNDKHASASTSSKINYDDFATQTGSGKSSATSLPQRSYDLVDTNPARIMPLRNNSNQSSFSQQQSLPIGDSQSTSAIAGNTTSSSIIASRFSDTPICSRSIVEELELSDQKTIVASSSRYHPFSIQCQLIIKRKSVRNKLVWIKFNKLNLDSGINLEYNCKTAKTYIQFNDDPSHAYCNLVQLRNHLKPSSENSILFPFDDSNNHQLKIAFYARNGFIGKRENFELEIHFVSPGVQPEVDKLSSTNERTTIATQGSKFEIAKNDDQTALTGRRTVTPLPPQAAPSADQCQLIVSGELTQGIITSASLQAKMRTPFPWLPSCMLRIKLLPAYCKLQLTFSDQYELSARNLFDQQCSSESLEMGGNEYCGAELRNATIVLTISDLDHRSVDIVYKQNRLSSLGPISGFRATFKQVECQQGAPLEFLQQQQPQGDNDRQQQQISFADKPALDPKQQVGFETRLDSPSSSSSMSRIKYEEIPITGDFFEIESPKMNPGSIFYAPNLYVVYRVKKFQPNVCKLRLLFNRFQLEPSFGCKRDFLDINNNKDRLCGELTKPEELSREYEWTSSGDFILSFVTDSSSQAPGFHLFGQQAAGCDNSSTVANSDTTSSTTTTTTTTETSPIRQDGPLVSRTTGVQKLEQHNNRKQEQEEHEKESSGGFSSSVDNPSNKNEQYSHVIKVNEDRELASPSPEVQQQQQVTEAPAAAPIVGCNRIIVDSEFELASPNWPSRYDRKRECYYLIQRPSSDICSLTVTLDSLILGQDERQDDQTRVDGVVGKIEALNCDTRSEDHLQLDDKVTLCGLSTRTQTYTIPYENNAPFLRFKFGSPRGSGFGFHLMGRQNKCVVQKPHSPNYNNSSSSSTQSRPEVAQSNTAPRQSASLSTGLSTTPKLEPKTNNKQQPSPSSTAGCSRLIIDSESLLESPEFGLTSEYGFNLNCLFAIRRLNESICAIDLVVRQFDLPEPDPISGSCQGDYIEIDHSRLCGRFPARQKMRFNYYEHELDKLIRFRTDGGAPSRSGFSMQVKQINNCRGHGSLTTSIAHQYSNNRINATVTEFNPINSQKMDRMSSGGGGGATIEYTPSIDSSSAHLAAASGRDPSAGGGSSLPLEEEPNLICQFVFQRRQEMLVSPGFHKSAPSSEVVGHPSPADQNIDCQYKIIASGYEYCSVRLVLLELELGGAAAAASGCANDYLLIDQQRHCALASRNETLELDFPDLLPRQVELTYHTSSSPEAQSAASGARRRGFKLLYEQLPCGDSTGPTVAAGARVAGGSAGRAIASTGSSNKLTGSAASDRRQLRLQKFGELAYPKDYVSGDSSSSSSVDAEPSDRKAELSMQDSETTPNDGQRAMMIHSLQVRDANHERGVAVTRDQLGVDRTDDYLNNGQQQQQQQALTLSRAISVMSELPAEASS